jgi:hypothetical protein
MSRGKLVDAIASLIMLAACGIDPLSIGSPAAPLSPAPPLSLGGALFLGQGGAFFTTVVCRVPNTCRDSGWGTYARWDSLLYLNYANNFWDTQYYNNQERGVFRGDTLLLYRIEDDFGLFAFTFVCSQSWNTACK